MKAIALTISSIALVTLFGDGTGMVTAENRKANLNGKIIAFRSADRILQPPSSVKNREVFLFLLSDSRPGESKRILLKLVYDHLGYSRLTAEVLRKTPVLQLKARRDLTCDESFRSFVSTAPSMASEQTRGEAIEGITYLGEFQKLEIPPERVLKCYVMEDGDFRRVAHP